MKKLLGNQESIVSSSAIQYVESCVLKLGCTQITGKLRPPADAAADEMVQWLASNPAFLTDVQTILVCKYPPDLMSPGQCI